MNKPWKLEMDMILFSNMWCDFEQKENFNVFQIKESKSCSYSPLFASLSYGFKKSQKRGGGMKQKCLKPELIEITLKV